MTNRRQSREWARELSAGAEPGDPIFFLRRVGPRIAGLQASGNLPLDDMALTQRRLSDSNRQESGVDTAPERARTPQEIIAAQRVASRAKQNAMLSAYANSKQGLDVVVPERGVLRSARVSIGGYDEVRYSYISEDGETYDISQLIQEELADTEISADTRMETLRSPAFNRLATDQTIYHTAPSTPSETPELLADSSGISVSSTSASDLLQSFVQQAQEEDRQEFMAERLGRVISKAKSEQSTPRASMQINNLVNPGSTAQEYGTNGAGMDRRRGADEARGRESVLASRDSAMSPQLEPIPASIRQAVEEVPSRSNSRQQMYSPTFEPNFRTITPISQIGRSIVAKADHLRHRQQPSIASILSDMSTPGERMASSTPVTIGTTAATTPQSQSMESIRKPLQKPSKPVRHKDDFGFGAMMATIRTRSSLAKRGKPLIEETAREVDQRLFGPDLQPALERLPSRTRFHFNSVTHRLAQLEADSAKVLELSTAMVAQNRSQTRQAKDRDHIDYGSHVTNVNERVAR